MNNPIKIFSDIRNAYLKYISSGLPFFRKEYGKSPVGSRIETSWTCIKKINYEAILFYFPMQKFLKILLSTS